MNRHKSRRLLLDRYCALVLYNAQYVSSQQNKLVKSLSLKHISWISGLSLPPLNVHRTVRFQVNLSEFTMTIGAVDLWVFKLQVYCWWPRTQTLCLLWWRIIQFTCTSRGTKTAQCIRISCLQLRKCLKSSWPSFHPSSCSLALLKQRYSW